MDTLIEHGDIMILFHRVLDDEERRQINDVLRRLIKAETIAAAVPGLIEALEEIRADDNRLGEDVASGLANLALDRFEKATK
jgi:hypothetical protein